MPSIHGPELTLDREALNNAPSMQEQSGGQVAIWGNSPTRSAAASTSQKITPLLADYSVGSPAYYKKVRLMKKHPTVKLVRVLSIASMAAAKWSVVTTDKSRPEAKDLINTLLPMQTHIMSCGLSGMFDFGWSAFEKVWKYDTEKMEVGLRKLKPLLQDQTTIMVEPKTGEFAGFSQFGPSVIGCKNTAMFLGKTNALLLSQDVEGTYWYGNSTMQAIEFAFNRWLVTDESNVRYDKKISGAHWVIHYPEGISTYAGSEMDNYDIANLILNALCGSGSVVIPRTVLSQISDLKQAAGDDTAWKVELISADTAQGAFNVRLTYLDAQIVRAGEFPERSILEGQYGTKAEAEAHADFAVARMDFRNKQIIEQLNDQLVNPMLRINYGEEAEGTVKLEVAPIADDKKSLLRNIYMGALSNPQMSYNEYSNLDMQAIRDVLQLPTLDKVEDQSELGSESKDSEYSQLHQMLANLNIDSDVIGSDSGAALPVGQQSEPQLAGVQ